MPVARSITQPLGVVYTPPEVARAMTHLALAPLVATASSSELLALRICDPAAGEGAFLLEAVSFLAEHLVAAWRREGRDALVPTARDLIARTCIVGVDIDERALRAASRALIDDAPGSPSSSASLPERVAIDLRLADALALDWRAAFPDVFANGGFDVVLANPPYIRQESLASKSALDDFEVYDGVADLYVYFIELAHRLVRPRGRYCVIVPNKWMTVDYGRSLRQFLANAHTLDGIIDLSTHTVFSNADAFPCIVWGTMGGSRDRRVIAVRANANESVDEAVHRASLASSEMANVDAAGIGAIDVPLDTIPRDSWSGDPWHIDSSSDRVLLERLAISYPTLGDVIGTRWSRGVVTGLNQAFVIDRETRDALVSRDDTCKTWMRSFIKGRDIRPYVLRPREGRLDEARSSEARSSDERFSEARSSEARSSDERFDDQAPAERWVLLVDRGTPFDALPAAIRDHLARFRERLEPRPSEHVGPWAGRKPGSYAWHELQDPVVPLAKSRAPRFLYQDIQTAPACCFDRDGELVPDTTVWILPSSDRYLLAILNSHVYHWYARRRFPPALNGAVRPKLAFMQRLPIPTPSRDLRREIETLVDRRIAATLDTRVLDAQIQRHVEMAYELSSIERALIAT